MITVVYRGDDGLERKPAAISDQTLASGLPLLSLLASFCTPAQANRGQPDAKTTH